MSAAEDFLSCESSSSEAGELEDEEEEEEEEYEERERRFDPANYEYLHNLPHQSLIQFDLETERSNLTYKCSETGQVKVDPTTIIIHLANRYNEYRRQPIFSWALYFGPQSRYNKSGVVAWWPEFISEEEAEYTLLHEALDHVFDGLSPTTTQVIIATDSSSLVELVTEVIPKLARNKDFRENNPLEFHDIRQALNGDEFCKEPLDFYFWLVPKEMNQEAHAMAECLMDREMQKVDAKIEAEIGSFRGRNGKGRPRPGLNY
ncbi:hypothetical protein FGADI_6239 [Fusarium gaditjirri]|uniref:RNase H type-1 domain-containing protein n=1 Tax=Fusarium gaditjirri TaxID=282569 RepID=A0A8H4WX52_9HYPO|nr:hypothetical protein FGADI_6239 [Fusarium gaditjirri]